MPREYLPLDLLFEQNQEGYRVRVLDSPAGQTPPQTFATPFDAPELAGFLARVGRRGPIAGMTVKPEELLKQFGGKLFGAVFSGEVLSAYRRSLDAADRAGQGLRVKLRLNDVPALAEWPWEYLYDTSREIFLGLREETVVVRFLELAEPVRPVAAPSPLQVLAVLASPDEYDPIDVEGDWSALNGALAAEDAKDKVTITRAGPTVDALLEILGKPDRAVHILHFSGHGEFSTERGQGALVFEDEAGHSREVSDERVATLLSGARGLRVVVLNACEGGRTAGPNPFVGVAPRLVQRGIPAVLAMQFPISDPAAVRFAGAFYRALADGLPVDAAVNQARRALYIGGSVLEWGTPVLFMRAADGRVFGEGEMGEQGESDRRAGGETRGSAEERRGGVNISGDARVSVGRDIVGGDKIVNGDEYDVAGDMNTVTIGAGAHVGQVAAGRHIQQSAGGGAGEQDELKRRLEELERALAGARGQLDAGRVALTDFQLSLLVAELSKSEGTPSATAITTAADGLVGTVPALGGPLGAVFKTKAGQGTLARAGLTDWAKKFG